MVGDEVIADAGRRLADAAGPGARVVLFGAHARGEARPGSDLDFLVIEPLVERPRAESARLRVAVGRIGAPVDVIVRSARDAERWGMVEGTLMHTALTEGRVLHG